MKDRFNPAPSLVGIAEATDDLVDTVGAGALLGIVVTLTNICRFGRWLDERVARRFCWYPGDLARCEAGYSISPGYHYQREDVERLLMGEQFV